MAQFGGRGDRGGRGGFGGRGGDRGGFGGRGGGRGGSRGKTVPLVQHSMRLCTVQLGDNKPILTTSQAGSVIEAIEVDEALVAEHREEATGEEGEEVIAAEAVGEAEQEEESLV